jgi:DNA primase
MVFERVVLFLDGDEAGRDATKEIGNRLMYRHYVRAVSLVQNIQPDQLSSEEIANILSPIV